MTVEEMTEFDPVLVAILQRQLDHISLQMGVIMTRTARSPIFSQSHDFTCFVAGAKAIAATTRCSMHW